MKKQLNYLQYLGFFAIGLVSNITGPMLPALRKEIIMSYTQSGLLLAGLCPGIICAILVGGKILDKFGVKPVLIFGSAALSLGLLGGMLSNGYLTLLSALIVSGLGFGTYEIGINTLCSLTNDSNRGNAMNFLHFFFGFGAIAGPFLVTFCINLLTNWRLVFAIAAIFPMLVMIMLKPLTLKKYNAAVANSNKKLFTERLLWVGGFFIFFYVGIETTIQGWIGLFWDKIAPVSLIPASLIASFFWGSLTVGRLLSGRIADRIGLVKYLIFISALSVILTFLWIFLNFTVSTFIFVLLFGLLFAGIYPTQMAISTSFYPVAVGAITAIISGMGSLGNFILPFAFGKIADWAGIMQLPIVIFGLSTLMFTMALYQKRLSGMNEIKA